MTLEEIAPSIGLEGFISWNWTRLGNRKHMTMNFGNVSGDMVSWGDSMVCAISKEGTTIRAINREKVKPFGGKVEGHLWDASLPKGYQATAVVICRNAVVVGGGIYSEDAKEARGFVRLLSPDKGTEIAERTLNAPLSYNGIAVAGDRIYATFAHGSIACLGSEQQQK